MKIKGEYVRKFKGLLAGLVLVFGVSGCSANETNNVDLVKDNLSETKENTFCTQDENIVFSCRLENKKTVSLCGKNKQLRYSYGKFGQTPELNIKGGNDIFKAGYKYFAGATVLSYISFKKDVYRYSVYQMDGKSLRQFGIVVDMLNSKKEYRKIYSNRCIETSIVSDNKNLTSVGLTYYDFLDSFKLPKDEGIEGSFLDY